MKKGKLLGSGITAEVYEWGPDKILKLYFVEFSTIEQLGNELNIGHIVYKSGIHTPAVHDNVEVDGRKGIIYERIYGKSVFERLTEEPWNLFSYIKKMAELQQSIHNFSAIGLPTQMESFTGAINVSSGILGQRVKKILEYTESLPNGSSICHGDLYFGNIIISGENFVPIDWYGAYLGNPLSDVARTGIVFCSPAVPRGFPDECAIFYYYQKWISYWIYIDEYIKLAKVRNEDIDTWQLPAAAARLKDNIPGEKNWLMDIIDKRLRQI